MRAGRK
jgi:hypothetical protein